MAGTSCHRALSAGIWRPVELVTHAPVEVARLYPVTVSLHDDVAEVHFYYELRGELPAAAEHQLVVSGQCGSSSFRFSAKVAGPVGVVRGEVGSPQLWWPRGYGQPDLYQLTTELQRDGETVARRQDRTGLRSVEVVRRPSSEGRRGDFHFVVNGPPSTAGARTGCHSTRSTAVTPACSVRAWNCCGGPIPIWCAAGGATFTRAMSFSIGATSTGSWSGRISRSPVPYTRRRKPFLTLPAKRPSQWCAGCATTLQSCCGAATTKSTRSLWPGASPPRPTSSPAGP